MARPRLWLVRAKVRGVPRIERWLAADDVAIGWREVGPLPHSATRDSVSWQQPETPLDRRELSVPAQRSLTTLLTAADLSHHADELLDGP